MADRITRLTVVLEQDIRDEHCQPLIDAINCLRGVASVSSTVTDFVDYDARSKVAISIRSEVLALLEKLRK